MAAGFRIYETTARENRGGVIRASYAHRGLGVKTSLRKAVEDSTPHKGAAKVYLSGGSGNCRGKTGFHLGGTYRPKEFSETTGFSGSQNVFADESTYFEFNGASPNTVDAWV